MTTTTQQSAYLDFWHSFTPMTQSANVLNATHGENTITFISEPVAVTTAPSSSEVSYFNHHQMWNPVLRLTHRLHRQRDCT
jgi:hypothetical protein